MGLRWFAPSRTAMFGASRLSRKARDWEARERSLSGEEARATQSRANVGAARNDAVRLRGQPVGLHPRSDNRAAIARLDHGHIVLGHASKVEKAFARFFVNGLDRFAAEHGLGFVDGYNKALWQQRQYQAPGQAERAARYLSKYVSKERAADWLREKSGQRVFYVAPWLSRAAGASMRVARMGRRLWASDHGYCDRPRCTEEELEAVMRFLGAGGGPLARAP